MTLDVNEIHRRAKRGPLALLARRAFAVVISILTTITIPHLVGPRAYGLAAMSTVILSFANMFKDFGLTSALLRKGEVSADEVSFLFWFNASTTIVLTMVLAISAPFAGIFFHEAIVTPVILVSLIGFAISGLSMQHRSLLSRDLRFQDLALVDAVVLAIQFVSTLIIGLKTHDVWAIVFGNIIAAFAGGIITVWISKWKPGRPKLIDGYREILKFGANSSIYTFAVFISTNITSILIGRFLGTYQLGQYNRANALLALPMTNAVQPITQATLPVLARLRSMPEHYRQTYLSLVRKLNLVVVPASIMLTFAAQPIVAAVLGAKWAMAGKLLQILGPAVAGLGFGYIVSDLFITQNRSAELRTLGIFELFVRVTVVSVGVCFGILMAALGYTIATLIVVFVRIYAAGRSGPVTLRDHLEAAAPAIPVSVGTAAGCAAGLTAATVFSLSAGPTAIVICGAGGLCAAAAGLVFTASRHAMVEVAATLSVPGAAALLRRLSSPNAAGGGT